MISGNDGKPNGSMLSIIDEDMEESLIGGSENLVALEENLFKEFHSSSANEDRKNSVVLSKNAKSAELNVVPTSAVSVFIASNQGVFWSFLYFSILTNYLEHFIFR